jgi:rare lipoprotein A (peptidoglycan hydrolase)
MPDQQDRCARKNDLTLAPGHGRPAARCLRWSLALITALALALVAVPAAGAATGGAAPVAAAPEAEAPVAEAGTEVAFGGFRFAGASWYGPGLWGRQTACGQTLRPTTVGVANKTLPCGTLVKFAFHGHAVTAPVIDRGPYVKGRAFDLTAAAAEALEFSSTGAGTVRYALPIEYASKGLR